MKILPGPPGSGIVFRRVDLDGFEVQANGRNVARVSYATSLMKKGVLLSTTEHLLAALYACGVDNVYVDIDRSEEHTSELQSPVHLVCRLLLEKKKKPHNNSPIKT